MVKSPGPSADNLLRRIRLSAKSLVTMSTNDQQNLIRHANELAQLFARIADERPDVFHALQTLFRALATTGPVGHGDSIAPRVDGVDIARAASDVSTEAPRIDCPHDENETADPGVDGMLDDGGIPSESMHAHLSATPEQEAEARRGLDLLKIRFGGFGDSPGLGPVPSTPPSPLASSPWDDDIDEANCLSRLLRAQARRLKAVRRARHSNSPIPPVDHVLAHARMHDWTADATQTVDLDAHDLREGERWYAMAARAAAEIGDWLSEHPDTDLGIGRTPAALRDRLQCLAIAQKGIFCWLQETKGRDARCALQERVFATLKSWVARDYFGVFLQSGLVLRERITSAERDLVEREFTRFELEHADPDPDAAQDSTIPSPKPSVEIERGTRTAADSEGFASVHDAFIAARSKFCDGLIVFTDRAEESAEDSAFKRPAEVYDFFSVMHGLAKELTAGQLEGTPLDQAFSARGYKSKPCVVTTMKRHRRFYYMTLDGRQINLSQHVTLGSRNQNTCMSIHWWHDKQNGRFVIGHCGKHLPNTRT